MMTMTTDTDEAVHPTPICHLENFIEPAREDPFIQIR